MARYRILVLSRVEPGGRKRIIGAEKWNKKSKCRHLAQRHKDSSNTVLSMGFNDIGPGAPGWAYSHFRSLSPNEKKELGLP